MSKLAFDFFRYIEKKTGRKIPFEVKLLSFPEELEESEYLDSTLRLVNRHYKIFPKKLKIDGDLRIYKTIINRFSEELEISGEFLCVDSNISTFSKKLKVGSDLNLRYLKSDISCDSIEVVGSASFFGTVLKKLPDNMKVGGSLDLRFTKLKKLPENLKVGGNLSIRATQIKELPDSLQVEGNIFKEF